MENDKKKDALTELVDITTVPAGKKPHNGTVSTPTGEKVELSITEVAKKLLESAKRRQRNAKG